MNRQPFTTAREAIVAKAIAQMVSELRLVEVADYIAFIRLERFANIADLVESAAELYFMPGTVRLGHGGDVRASWSQPPEIVLDLELRPQGVTVYLRLTMKADHAELDVNYVSFDDPADDPTLNNAFLEEALEHARIRKTQDAAASPL